MKRYLIFSIIILFCANAVSAQINQWKFFVGFTDKNSNPFSVSVPSAYLSAKAIQRRTAQNISIKQDDLPVNPQYIDSLIAKGATIGNKTKWLNGVVVSVPDSASYNKIMALPFVRNVIRVRRPEGKGGIKKFDEENNMISLVEQNNADTRAKQPSQATVFSYQYGNSYNQIHLMNGDYLHDNGFHGEGMVIALLDAGFYHANQLKAFDSLNANNQVLGTWDFVANESSVYEDDSHGGSVLSCIAGNVPDSLVGTAPKAQFWLLRSEDAPIENIIEEYNWATAAEYADSVGADIISSSLGYTQFDSLNIHDSTLIANPENHTYADMDGNTCPSSIAADVAASKGMLVLVAVGNSGNGSWHYLSAPSDADSVLAIGAVDSTGYHVSFSSWGPSADGDIKPNVDAKGLSTIVSYGNGVIGPGSGTSFATPVLAGSAACLWQAHPSKTNMEVFDAIQRSANYFLNPNDSLGFGIPDFKLADEMLGIADQGHEMELVVYPNPISNELRFLSSAILGKISIDIFDESGRIVFSGEKISDGIHSVAIPQASEWAKGIYFLQVIKGEKTVVKRIAKM